MKNVLLLIFILLSNLIEAQVYQMNSDSIVRFYLNDEYELTNKSNCLYFREMSFPKSINMPNGKVIDFLQDSTLIFTSYFINNQLNDSVFFYYKNGNIKMSGKYLNGKRNGLWSYYYQNRHLKKVIDFQDSLVFIRDFYKKNGKQLIKDGYGKYQDEYILENDITNPAQINGEVVNGLMNGKWKLFYSLSQSRYVNGSELISYSINESYTNGKFINGTHELLYEERGFKQQIVYSLTNTNKDHYIPFIDFRDKMEIEDFTFFTLIVSVENSYLNKYPEDNKKNAFDKFTQSRTLNNNVCFKNTSIKLPYFRGKQNFNSELIPILENTFSKTLKRLLPDDCLLLSEVYFSAEGLIDSIKMDSNKKIKDEYLVQLKMIYNSIFMNSIESPSLVDGNKHFKFILYLPFYFTTNKVYLPSYMMDIERRNFKLFKLLN